jgi:hypothetical protein
LPPVAESLAHLWHDLIVEELWWRLDATKLPATAVAGKLRLSRDTVTGSRYTRSDNGQWASYPVLAGLALVTGTVMRVQPLTRAWPRAPWETFGSLASAAR